MYINRSLEDTVKHFDILQLELKVADIQDKLSASTGNSSSLYKELSYYSSLLEKVKFLNKKSIQLVQSRKEVDSVDEEMRELLVEEIKSLETEVETLANEVNQIEIDWKYKDDDDDRSVIVEIRAGAGGTEASLFAGDLFRMYSLFSDMKNWKIEVQDASSSEVGGFSFVIAAIRGKSVYKYLKNESGVHRVQRVPVTESSGRIHTSTASVAIMPEPEPVDVTINNEDLRIDVMRASGAGGQCVNRTDSAVRITHIPTGIVVSCQETKHQSQNKEKAMNILKARLYALKKEEADLARSSIRSAQIGKMDRSEKIRTYNFPQSRITDHRVKLSWFNIQSIMDGDIENMCVELNRALIQQLLDSESI